MNTATTYRDPTVPVEVQQGTSFALVLESNPSTGYQWQLAQPLDTSVVQAMASKYRPAANAMPGAAGSEEWLFRAAGAGRTTIVLSYVRPWEKGVKPIKTSTFHVIVQ